MFPHIDEDWRYCERLCCCATAEWMTNIYYFVSILMLGATAFAWGLQTMSWVAPKKVYILYRLYNSLLYPKYIYIYFLNKILTYLLTYCIADICATMPTSENGSTITVSWMKLDTRTGTFHLEWSTRVLPTFSANNVSPSNNPLEDMGRPPTVCMVQWSTASEYGGIEQWPTVKTRPDRAVSILCNLSI